MQFSKKFKILIYFLIIFLFFSRDLSETNIIRLPVIGLEDLEILKIMRTFSLKQFPSVLELPSIREAYLTYPYHCCAFSFPKEQSPETYNLLEKLYLQNPQ